MGFTREAIEAVGDNWLQVEQLNNVLDRLRQRRLPAVQPNGPSAKSKMVWKVVTFQQSILYRIVMLADGCSEAWNTRNPLVSIICARAIMETGAQVLDFESQLNRLCAQGDLKGIDGLVMNRIFGTRLPEWQQRETGTTAVNALNFIDKMDGIVQGARGHYDVLSEWCHPNSIGHFQMFGKLDQETATLHLSDVACFNNPIFSHVFAGFLIIGLVENALGRIDTLLPRVLELSGSAPPN